MGIFGKKSRTASKLSATTIIAKGCRITGSIQLACDIQVDGEINGKLSSEKSIVISKEGRIEGEIYADKIIVNGIIEGTCYANSIEVLENGKINGATYSDDLSIERGGLFLGETHLMNKEQVVNITDIEISAEEPVRKMGSK